MKIFITGATGFIGTELLNQLKNTDHEIVCLVRKTSPKYETIKKDGIAVFEGDIRNKSSVLQAMKGCDQVINLAGLYSFWQANNKLYREINVEGTRNVLECALENKILKVVHISSVVTFGKPNDKPFTEKSKAGSKLFSRYAKTKAQGDKIALEMYKKEGLPLVLVYPAVVLGSGNPKTSGQYISDMVHKRMPAQVFTNQGFTWVHVKDVAEGIIKALEKQDNIGEKYILGKHLTTIGEINKLITDISGTKLPKITMPAWMALVNAYLLTGISRITKKKPPLSMYVDQIRTMSNGIYADGSKAERELGIHYTPVKKAVEDEIKSF